MRAWARPVLVIAIVAVLIGLGIANVVMRARWHEVEDGVLWGARSQGVTAIEVAADSPAAESGVKPGDVLLAVNGVPVESPADVVEYQHSRHGRHALSYYTASDRQSRSARPSRWRKPRARPRCTSCLRPSACSR